MVSAPVSSDTVPRKRVLLAAPRGYCAGVDRAVQTVENALERFGAPVYVRKEIVHNKHVVEGLRERGAIFVDELADSIPEGAGTVLDNTVMVFMSEMRTHDHDGYDLPIVMLGGGGQQAGEVPMVARVDPVYGPAASSRVEIGVDPARLHFFDLESELSIQADGSARTASSVAEGIHG